MQYLTLFSIPPLLSALLVSAMSIHVFVKNPRSRTHQAFLYFCLSLVVWLFCHGVAYSCKTPAEAARWLRWGFYGVAFIPATDFYFYTVMLNIKKTRWIIAFFVMSILIALVHHLSPLIYKSVAQFPWGYYPQVGSLHWLFIDLWMAAWVYGLKLVSEKMTERKKMADFIGYNQARYLFFGLIGQGLGIVDFLPAYGIAIYPAGYLVAVYWCVIVAFAITRYKMLADISFLTRRVLIGSALLAEMASIYFFIDFSRRMLTVDDTIYLITVSMAVGMILMPLASATKNKIDQLFFPEFFERKEKLSRLGQEILLCKNPSEFNQIILDSIFKSFKITKSYLFLWNEERKGAAESKRASNIA